jgi:hypothetical protein
MQFSEIKLDAFAAFTSVVIGNRESALFWEDRWLDGKSIREIASEGYTLISKRCRKQHTVQLALVERSWISNIGGAPSALALWQYV